MAHTSAVRNYEIVYDRFNRRWTFKRQRLPGALKVAATKAELIEKAMSICRMESCAVRIYLEDGQLEEERTYGMGGVARKGPPEAESYAQA